MRALVRLVTSDSGESGPIPGDVPSGKPGNGHHHSSTVLVAEDEILVRMTVSDYLRDAGYRVIEVSNADEARAVFAAGEPIELVFSDVNMPGQMNGLALAEWIRIRYPDVKVILTSGARDVIRPVVEARPDELFLLKPYSYEELRASIRRLLAV